MDRVSDVGAPTIPSPAGGPSDRLLSWPKVREISGLSRTTAWRMQKAGDFPPPVRVSAGRVGWWQSDLDRWKASRAPRPPSEARVFDSETVQSAPLAPKPLEAAGLPETSVSKPCGPAKGKRGGASPDQFAFDF